MLLIIVILPPKRTLVALVRSEPQETHHTATPLVETNTAKTDREAVLWPLAAKSGGSQPEPSNARQYDHRPQQYGLRLRDKLSITQDQQAGRMHISGLFGQIGGNSAANYSFG